jgi:serine/threonine-protein kinase
MIPPHDDIDVSWSDRALEVLRKRPWAYAALAVVVFALGTWIYVGVRAALVDLAADNLRALLAAQEAALDTWIGEKRLNVGRWADDPRVQAVAARLAVAPASAGGGTVGDDEARLRAGCASADRRRLIELIDALRGGDAASAVNLVDRDGRLVATRFDVFCGRRISEAAHANLAPVYAGKTTFAAPVTEQERIGVGGADPLRANAGAEERRLLERPLVWFAAPVRNADGAVIAVLNIAKPADEKFSALFANVRVGDSGEVYAFDARGRLLSQSRFRDDLQGVGRVRADESEILRVRLDDPEAEGAARPLTRLVADALARRRTQVNEQGDLVLRAADEGEVMVPYANYLGQRVVGAWRWLPSYNFGVAIEIGAAEAYAPLRRLELAFGGMVAAAGVASLFLLVALGRIVRLRRERDTLLRTSGQVGNYELFDEIGQGGGARVYRARHRLLKRPTAVKIIHLHKSSDELLARFDREVRLASQLMHPNTIEIFDFGRTPEGLPYYAMELLHGLTLEQMVTRGGAFPAARVAHVLRAIAGALAEAHDRGLVHRDVTPANIMLCAKGGEYDVPKLLDFGLIKDTRAPHTRELTRAVLVIGTPPYLAPERFEKPESADLRSDLYALGAVGYFLLAGRPPFEATTDLSLAYHVVHTPAAPIEQAAKFETPAKLAQIVMQCLAKRPDDRPQSATAIAAVLDALTAETPWPQHAARAWWEANPVTAPVTEAA